MDFSTIINNIQNWVEHWPKERTDEMSLISKAAISEGWYLNEVLLFGIYSQIEDYDDFPSMIESLLLENWDDFWDAAFKAEPSQYSLLFEAKECFESGLYGASIHLFFSQADGVFHDHFGKSLYKKEGERAKAEADVHLKDVIARESLEQLISQFKDASVLRRMFNEVYKEMFSVIGADPMKNIDPADPESALKTPNRHGVLHGMHKEYASKANALKVFSMFLFVLYAIHGESLIE
ncbi:hypothetical protein [Celerinatantimonas diazotrophica]|uniref:Uncharacterized protein n=1 Tax=Celerinatantimonas diazotrophica TaxID=412034 RepID=A0A4R1JBN2_9GAMM|nr:hypothetical protein [Celerinatantimonas diazotrophica]TCK47559.1 hypothetical protein EV690_2594 [Celerinatantimonas diazotrophica]CAG9296820.1 hypothetical protein CEDIAZO_01978 [Celerinatantimonas diazotrophica]